MKLSHYERLNKRCSKFIINPVVRRVLKEENVYDENTHRYIRKSSYVTDNPQERMKNYRVSDFSMSNLIALGVKSRTMSMTPSINQINSNVVDYISTIEQHLQSGE